MPNNFGYEPAPLPSSIAQYDDYTAGQSVDYQPTPWDDFSQVNIETMWTWIQNESDEKTRAVAEMWRRIGVLLESTRTNVERYGTALQQSWQSPAATEFLRRVGAALYSLDEWHQATVSNASALNTAADKISTTQTRMKDIWEQFTRAAADAERRREEEKNDGVLMSIVRGFTEDPPSHDEVRREYTDLAKPVMKALADTYTDSALNMDRGTVFKGPTAADTRFADGGSGTSGSGGYGGGYGWAGGSMPSAPAMPSGPGPDASLPELAGMLPPAPPLPMPGTPLPAPAPMPPGAPPPLPGMPVPPVPGPVPPTTQNPPRPGRLPAVPTEPPVRTPPVSRPNLTGTSPRTGVPAPPGTQPPPSAPRRPNLTGTSTRNVPVVPRPMPGSGVPTEPTTTAVPRLDGRHGSRPVGPVRAGGTGLGHTGQAGRPAGTVTSSNLAGRRKPDAGGISGPRPTARRGRGSTSQVLGGRTTPVGDTVPGRPHGPALGDRSGATDRGSGTARPADPQRRRDGSEDEPWQVEGGRPAVEPPKPSPDSRTAGRRGE